MENKQKFIINVLYYVLIIALVLLFCKYLLPTLWPFILGFLFAYISIVISKKVIKRDTKIIRIICLLLLYLIVYGLLTVLVVVCINEIIDFMSNVPTIFKNYIEPVLSGIQSDLNDINSNLPYEIRGYLSDIISSVLDSIKSIISSFSSFVVSKATALISNTTNVIINVIVTMTCSAFFLLDYEKIIEFFESRMSTKVKDIYNDVTFYIKDTVFKVVGSYGMIMGLTFVELLIGFLIIGIDNASILALLISFLDILPILGVGTVLIPWCIIDIVLGNIGMGIAILVLYLVITFIRNIVEPKIVGGNLGLHPIATLCSMIVGLNLLGGVGMFGLPLFLSFMMKRQEKDS